MFALLAGCVRDTSTHFAHSSSLINKRSFVVHIDHEFNYWQEKEIAKAFSEWTEASDGTITFKLIWNQPRRGLYKDHIDPKKDDGIFLWYLDKEDKNLTPELVKYFEKINGLYVPGDGSSSNLLIFHQVPEYHFKAVVLHEIGHLLGLNHIEEKGHLMSPAAGVSCLTLKDTQALCKHYNCVPRSFCMTCQ